MANELRGIDTSGNTEYTLLTNELGKFWNGTTFETYSALNYATYVITLTESGSSGIYFGDFPALVTNSGTYEYISKRQAGGSPAETDSITTTGKVDWTGSSSASGNPGSMSGSAWRDYVLRGGFKRTDKDTELFEETTDAIQEMRRRFGFSEAEAETTTTDTISVLGDFGLSLESDFGLLVGIILEDGNNATPLIQRTKKQFDDLYPFNNADPSFRGYPKDFCIYAGAIQIGPIPDQTSYLYRIAYSQRAGTVTSATSAVPFTREYRDVLRDLVESKLSKLMEEFDKAQLFRAEYERGFLDSQRRERHNNGAGVFRVRPFGM